MKNFTLKYLSLYSLIGLLTFAVSCGSAGNNDKIAGTFKGVPSGTMLYLDLLGAANSVTVDSVILGEEGEFAFNPQIGTKTFYRIRTEQGAGAMLLMDSTEQVKLELDTNIRSGYSVEGSEDSKRMSELSNIMNGMFFLRDSLNQVYRQNINQLSEEMVNGMRENLQQMEASFRSDLRTFILENKSSLAVLAAFEQLNIDTDFEVYEEVDKTLGEKYPNSAYFQSFHTKFEYQSQFAVGRTVPEITLPSPNGEAISLTSLRGKIVLIDFWASWCKPCRMENPNVVRLYNQYKDENFEIFSVSLDRERNAWLQAIEQDQMDWVHVSDLMFWQSPVVKLYNINGIPHTLLIDEEGRILAKNLRGEQLANKLREIFG